MLQSDDLILSTLLVAPTSRAASARVFRSSISIGGEPTQVLVEQTTVVAPERLGELVGHASLAEMNNVDAALRLVLMLD